MISGKSTSATEGGSVNLTDPEPPPGQLRHEPFKTPGKLSSRILRAKGTPKKNTVVLKNTPAEFLADSSNQADDTMDHEVSPNVAVKNCFGVLGSFTNITTDHTFNIRPKSTILPSMGANTMDTQDLPSSTANMVATSSKPPPLYVQNSLLRLRQTTGKDSS